MLTKHQNFLKKIEHHIDNNLKNEQFGVGQLSKLMGMSRSHLHRKLKKIHGKSVSQVIREYRLEVAKKMLLKKEITASEVTYHVGFSSPSYFSKCFTKYFGYPPSKAKGKNGYVPQDSIEKGFIKLDKTIMVLPFKNLSPNEHNQYLVDGMVDAIDRHLSNIDGLKVVSSLVLSRLIPIKEIGEKYGVSSIVQGSIQQQANTIRIEIKLLDTYDGKIIWAQNYDRNIFDVLEIQGEIFTSIVRALKINISKEEYSLITKRTSYDSVAYDNYLKGMYYMNQLGTKEVEKSLEYFKKAIKIENSITPAYSAIANYYHMKASTFAAGVHTKEAFRKAKQFLAIAIKLDKDWHFNFTMKGFQLAFFQWKFLQANQYYQMGLKDNKPLNYIMYRDYLQIENRHEEALQVSLYLDKEMPFYPNFSIVMSFYYNSLYEEGETYIEERLPFFSANYSAYDNSGFFYLNIGKYDQAIHLFQKAIQLVGKRFPRILGWMGAAYAKKGEPEQAKALLRELQEMKVKNQPGSPAWFMAVIHTALGETVDALRWIRTAIDEKEMEVPWLVSEPQFYPLHQLTEFDALVKRVGFRERSYPVKLPKALS
ncbi:helix-turn-helix domain-containing protein [Tunicatimonas pelagia]|uniref:helix-turn-helix domain-containing protein n=1 Tax=Tunicatimonas pelagia TaxID=931531 RepID=UPI0026660034|nr:helix-turn-helix domain-containing protein [Tunicatimonas pelagia]WKN42936.1 helix-turn-helix domain-containing protein [Tunicatimonas pelagia]